MINLQTKNLIYKGLSGFQIEHKGNDSKDIYFTDGGDFYTFKMCTGIHIETALHTAKLLENSSELLKTVDRLIQRIEYLDQFLPTNTSDLLKNEAIELLNKICND
jgi:hypothetical protein